MILKFLHKNITRLNYNPLIKNSAFFFSKQDGDKKGFGRFSRKTTPEPKKQEQKIKSPEKQITEQKKGPGGGQGFSNFKRKPEKQNVKEPQKTININQNEKNKMPSETDSATNKIKLQQKQQKPVENQKKNQARIEQDLKGFNKFVRKANQTNKSVNIQTPPQKVVDKPLQKPVQESQPQHQQQSKNNQEQIKLQQIQGFQRFRLKKNKPNISEKKAQNNQNINQKGQNLNQGSPQGQKVEKNTNNQNTQNSNEKEFKKEQLEPKKQAFQNFKKKSLKSKAKGQQQSPSPKPENEQKQKKEAQATSNMKAKNYKSLQEIQKQEAELELKNKQQFFKKKVEQYKQKKAQQQKPTYLSQLLEVKRKIEKEFQQRTGIDLNSYRQPPQWVKSNPMLALLFSRWKGIAFALILYLFLSNYSQSAEQITSEQFIQYIDSGQAKTVIFKQNEHDVEMETGKKHDSDALIRLSSGELFITNSNNDFENLVINKINILNSINPSSPIVIVRKHKENFNLITTARFILSMSLVYMFFSSLLGTARGGKAGGKPKNLFDQTRSKRFQQKVNVKFTDVVGMQKSKQEIVEFIDFLVNPDKYHRLGAKIPRGALLTGPPGTGKTMIAKACAGESNVPFFTISGSQFIQMYVGVGAQRVRDLFKQAKEAAPSIIFIDEIDAVGKKRSSGMSGNDERDNTLNQLLVQMDGFESNSNVIVFAATNQKDVLDPALTRPGRFDRLIEVDLPDIEGRKQIFMVHLKPIVIDQQSSMEDYARRMATLTPGFSGADIKNLCNEAAIMAARNGNKFVTIHDFELATQRVIAGVQKKSHLITEQTRRVVAYHECGHGVASWFLEGANPLLKITIIPRSKGSLGFAQYLPHETQISNKKQLEDQICVILAGRVAEEAFFGRISTGAYDDLQKAYRIAKMIVTQYGMDQKLGWLTYQQSQYAKFYSKETQEVIDQQITKIIKDCTSRTRALIQSKRELIDKLAHKLLEVETIDLTKIAEILGERPFKPNKQYEEYLNEKKKMIDEIDKNKNNPNDSNSEGEGDQKEGPIAAMSENWKGTKFRDYLL